MVKVFTNPESVPWKGKVVQVSYRKTVYGRELLDENPALMGEYQRAQSEGVDISAAPLTIETVELLDERVRFIAESIRDITDHDGEPMEDANGGFVDWTTTGMDDRVFIMTQLAEIEPKWSDLCQVIMGTATPDQDDIEG